jgi:hypothetical protein
MSNAELSCLSRSKSSSIDPETHRFALCKVLEPEIESEILV